MATNTGLIGSFGMVLSGAMVLAACGASSTQAVPQGLTGSPAAAAPAPVSSVAAAPVADVTQQAGSYVQDQVTDDDKAARTTLDPAPGSFLAGKQKVTFLASTTPANGDVNPYAIWPVTQTIGSVTSGDVLVDNFNNKSNKQGTGTTIVDVHPDGSTTVFADLSKEKTSCPGGIGLTTAMVQLKTGWVIVGSVPSTDGTLTTGDRGCLLVLSPSGKVVETLSESFINGPWDAAVSDQGDSASLFITNAMVGLEHSPTATTKQANVVRISLAQTPTSPPKITGSTVVADGLPAAGDASAFLRGPTGLALGGDGTLYVSDTSENKILSVPQALTRTDSAGTGKMLTTAGQLANPLGLAIAPNGNLLAANATNGKIVEITTAGVQVGEYYAIENIGQDPPGNGDLFGIAINQAGTGILFVKDDENSLVMLQ